MKFSRVKARFPLRCETDEIKPGEDILLKSVHHRNTYLASKGEVLTEEILENLKQRDKELLWINRELEIWLSRPELATCSLLARETVEIEDEMGRVINRIAGISKTRQMRELVNCLLEEQTEKNINDILNKTHQLLSSLKPEETNLTDQLIENKHSFNNQNLTQKLSRLLANPDYDPEKISVPTRQKKLFGQFLNFIFRLLKCRSYLISCLLESKQKPIFQKIQGLLNQFEEEPARPGLVELIHIHALRSEKKPRKEDHSDLVNELLHPVEQDPAREEIKTVYRCVEDIFEAVIYWKTFFPHLTKRLRERLAEMIEKLPDPHWALTVSEPDGNSLIAQAINRLILYCQVWREEILDQEALNRLPAILLREIGLLKNPRLVGRSHPVVPDSRVDENSIDDLLKQSIDTLRKVSGFPPEALEIIRAQSDTAGPNSEWVVREAQRIDVCAGYDSLTTSWPWREALPPGKAYNDLWKNSSKYGPELLNHFCSRVGVFPSGVKVTLTNDKLCLVEKQTADPELPEVIELEVYAGGKLNLKKHIDLRESKLSIGEVPEKRIASWKNRRARLNQL